MRKEPSQKTESATYSPTNQANRSIDSQVFENNFSISYLCAKLEISSFKHWYTIRLTEEIGGSVNAALVYI